MAQNELADSEAAFRASATLEDNPTKPAGFLRAFDAIVFRTVAREALARAYASNTGLLIRRQSHAREMASYFNAATSCARDLEGKITSPETIAIAIGARVRKFDLRNWFKVVLTDRAPDPCSTHFLRYIDNARGGAEETVELLPDLFVTQQTVQEEYGRMHAGNEKNSLASRNMQLH